MRRIKARVRSTRKKQLSGSLQARRRIGLSAFRHGLLGLLFITMGAAAVVDRLALVVGKTVFTQSEVDDESRLGELQAGKPPDLSAASRKAAAERLVDQQLLRNEMNVTAFKPPATDADALVRQFRQAHFTSLPLYRAALARYGVTEEALKEHLQWEVAVLRFTDHRFRPMLPDNQVTVNQAQQDTQSANRTANDSASGDTVDKEMETWLKQQRADTRIVFKREAFQ
jgi:hypothetical protein